MGTQERDFLVREAEKLHIAAQERYLADVGRQSTEEVLLVQSEDDEAARIDTEAIILDDIPWEATHTIGPYIVQERTFVNGLKYWVEKNGQRRIPREDRGRPLVPYIAIPRGVIDLHLTLPQFALAISPLINNEGNDLVEDGFSSSRKLTDRIVRLTLKSPGEDPKHYLVLLPPLFTVTALCESKPSQ